MKISFISLLIALFMATPAMAEKPSWTGQGKPTSEKRDAFKSAAMDNKAEVEGAEGEAKEKMKQAKALNKASQPVKRIAKNAGSSGNRI